MLLQSHRKSRKRRQRRVFIGCVFAGIGVMLYLIAGPTVKRRYLTWKYNRTVAQAAEASGTKDVTSPAISLQNSVRSNPGNPVAWRMAADYLNNSGDRSALYLREQIIEREPTVIENRLALVRTALRFRDIGAAEAALDVLPETTRHSVEYKRVAASVALVAGRNAESDNLVSDLPASSPDPARAKLDRQLMRLHFGNFSQASDAAQEIENASRQPELRAYLLRELTFYDLRRNEPTRALARVDTLLQIPEHTFADELLRADIVLSLTPEKLPALQLELRKDAATDAANAVLFAGWLGNHGQMTSAANWIDSLPTELQQDRSLRSARTGLALVAQNWELSTRLLSEGAWGKIAPQTVQLAMSARLLETRERPELRRDVWGAALAATDQDLSGLEVLRQLALLWKWDDEYQTTLFTIARKFPDQTWAHQLLAENFFRKKQTNELRAVYALWHQAEPANTRVEATWTHLELLSAPANTENELTARAFRLYQAEPENPVIAVAYSLALYQLGRTDEALTTLDKLPAAERRQAGRAFYYALYLATAKRTEEARTYLELSSDTNLLSEEKTLLNRARNLAEARHRSP